jgi:hypothetical protein
MPQFKFSQQNSKNLTQKILSVPRGAFIALQVLDASTLFFDKSKEILDRDGMGAAAPNNVEGFQIKSTNNIFTTWWKGDLWGKSDTDGGLINASVLFELAGKGGGCGCGDGVPAIPEG